MQQCNAFRIVLSVYTYSRIDPDRPDTSRYSWTRTVRPSSASSSILEDAPEIAIDVNATRRDAGRRFAHRLRYRDW